MGISLSVKGDGISFAANLKDGALPGILELVKKHRDGGAQQGSHGRDEAPLLPTPSTAPAPRPVVPGDDGASTTLNVAARGAAELLNELNWETSAEKILLLGAWHEAKGNEIPWKKADIETAFGLAKEKLPANLSRDIVKAITEKWVNAVTPRTYTITRTGWNKIGAAFSGMQHKT